MGFRWNIAENLISTLLSMAWSRPASKAEELVGRTFAVKASCGKVGDCLRFGLTSLQSPGSHQLSAFSLVRWAASFSFVVAACSVRLAFSASVLGCEVTKKSFRVKQYRQHSKQERPPPVHRARSPCHPCLTVMDIMLHLPNLAPGSFWGIRNSMQARRLIISESFCEEFSSDDYETLVWDPEPCFTLAVSR